MTHTARILAILAALALTGGCDVGNATGSGGGDGSGDGDGMGGGGGGGGGGMGADAIAEPLILCSTEYTITGELDHDVLVGESCDGTGTWTVTVSAPVSEEYDPCQDAPENETFSFTVTMAEEVYSVTDDDDPGRAWTVQVRDKGGSCSATFKHDLGDGAEWSLIPSENGPDGPLDGSGRYEVIE